MNKMVVVREMTMSPSPICSTAKCTVVHMTREAQFLLVLVSTLTCVSDLLPSVLASVHTCNHRACKDMYSAWHASHGHVREPTHLAGARAHTHPGGNVLAGKPKCCPKAHPILPPLVHAHTLTHTETPTRSLAHTGPLVGAVLGGKPRRSVKAHPSFHRRCTRTHTQPHTHAHTRSARRYPRALAEGQRLLHVFSRWRGLGPRRYPRILPMIKDTYTVSPAGAVPGPRNSYTPWDSWVLRLKRSCELWKFLAMAGTTTSSQG